MKSLICALNTKYVHSSLAPWCLKAGVRYYAPSAECEILEVTINESEQSILDKIFEKEFELIGFCTYIWNVRLVLSLCEKIKRKRNVKTVLGGPEVSYNAKNILLENPFVDYVISGEGEKPFGELCGDKTIENIDGLCYRNNGEIVIKEPHVSCVDPPSPYTEEYFSRLEGRIAYLETSRGCPYRCAFCLSGRCGGVRFFDINEAKKNIVALANSGAKTIKLVDRTFNADKKRARELLAFIIDNYGEKISKGVCFHFEIEGDILDCETIEILSKAEAGTIQMEIGLQSFNEKTLEAINRKSNTTRLCENIKRLINLQNIHIHIDLIAGLPYEDYKSFEEGFNKALALKPHMLQFGFLKMLHGSDLRENDESWCEYQSAPPYEIRSTLWLSNKELELMHITEDFFDRFYNSGRFSRTAEYIYQTFENPFKIYTELGVFVKNNEKIRTLDSFAELVYNYLSALKDVDKNKLRDLMALDRLASNRMGNLPEFLKIHSPKLKELLNMLEENPKTRRKSGVKRAITLMKTKPSAYYVDYDAKNPITGEYKLIEILI